MVSTLLGYRLYAGNIAKSLERLEASPAVKRDADYYKAHIGDVRSPDDLLSDTRLYSYAMKAYGLEDQVASKGLMRKVLESDLSDSASFANKLVDARYRTFAAAFNFKAVAGNDTKVVQSTAQTESVTEAYSERRVRQGIAASARTADYAARIGDVESVGALLDDSKLLAVVLGSIGVDPATAAPDAVRQALTGTLPADFATSNPGWSKLAEAFNFEADGSVPAGYPAQDADAANALIYRYNQATGNNASPASAAFDADYFQAKTAGLARIDPLFDDPRLFSFTMTAFGFDPAVEDPAYAKAVVEGGSGAGSPLDRMPEDSAADRTRKARFAAMVSAFERAGQGATQRDAVLAEVVDGFYANYRTVPAAKDASATSTFKYLLGDISSLTGLLARDPVFGRAAMDYALRAFDIDPGTVSLSTLRKVLTSDVSDPASFVNRMNDPRFAKLAAAFNFDANGAAAPQRLVQSTSAQTETGTRYTASFGTMTAAKKAAVRTETQNYLTAIGGMRTLDDFLSDPAAMRYALTAYGLSDAKLSTADVRRILTSDLGDPKSFANTANDKRYVSLAKAFNVEPDGTVRREDASVQSGSSRLTTENQFLLQTLETKAGEENDGVRLALYFRRKAPELASVTGILADKALLQVVKTAFALPDAFSQLDIDRQIKVLDGKLKVADFADAKKLDAFVSRFAALYDVQNAKTSTSPLLQLFNGGSTATSGISALL